MAAPFHTPFHAGASSLRLRSPWIVPVAVLLLGWAAVAVVFRQVWHKQVQLDGQSLTRLAANAEDVIVHRIDTYTEALEAGASFIRGSKDVQRSEWHEFAASLDVDGRYPGIRGIGLVYPVRRSELPAFLARVRADDAPDFVVRDVVEDAGMADELGILTYIEPAIRNAGALGLNLLADANRREAAWAARDSGEPRLTRSVQLVQDGGHRAGAVLFVPVYRAGSHPATTAERRAQHVAWVCAPLVIEELFEGALGHRSGQLHLAFYEGDSARPDRLLYASERAGPDGAAPERVAQLTLAGQRFTFVWTRGAQFVPGGITPYMWAGAAAAIGVALLAGLIWSLQGTTRRAQALARELMRDMEATRKNAEDSVARTQQLLEKVTSRLPGMVGYWTADLRCAFSNAEYLEWFGQTAEEMHGMRMQDLLGEELFRRNEPYVRGVLAGHAQHFERVLTKTNGDVRHTWAQYIPDFESDGTTVRGFLVLVSDVTEMKRQEDALRISEAKLRVSLQEVTNLKTALDAHAIVAITDAHGVITYANEKFSTVSQYSREELIGNSHRITRSGHHPPEFFQAMWRTIQQGRIWHGEICNRAKDGSLYWVDATIVPFLDETGHPVQYIAVRTDITERKQLEQNLAIARDQALEASRLKSEFLATMSHEIRTPMNAIIGMAGLVADTPLNPEQADMIRIVTGAAESLLTIINDILDFSRIEAGQLRLDVTEFDVARVITETAALLAPRAREKDIALNYDVKLAPQTLLLGDAGRVRQILVNLVGNAVKFTDRGEVFVRGVVVRDTPEMTRVRISVRDTGIGIPPEARERLFRPFVQVDGSATRRFGGTGLGLAITRQLVTAMGGEMGYESEPSRGSTFWAEIDFPRRGLLPVRCEEAGSEQPGAGSTDAAMHRGKDPSTATVTVDVSAATSRCVLLVEDNEANRRVASVLLARLGYAVDLATNGHQALEKLATQHFDAVLMDCQMPYLDGYETTRWIRAGKIPGINPRVPVIALTAYARPEDRTRCEEAGMDGYLAKPIRRAELVAALEHAAGPGRPPKNGRKATGVLDAEVVETARALPGTHGPSLLPELVELYLDEEPARLRRISRLVAERAGTTLAAEVHSLGGNAASFGGLEVRRAALELEESARANRWTDAERQLAELTAACGRLRAAADELSAPS